MKNNIFIKITMVILLISILLSSVSSVTVIADSSTTLGESKQAPLNITVNNNGVDETDIYKATNTINVNAGTRGTLGNIYYGFCLNCTSLLFESGPYLLCKIQQYPIIKWCLRQIVCCCNRRP